MIPTTLGEFIKWQYRHDDDLMPYFPLSFLRRERFDSTGKIYLPENTPIRDSGSFSEPYGALALGGFSNDLLVGIPKGWEGEIPAISIPRSRILRRPRHYFLIHHMYEL